MRIARLVATFFLGCALLVPSSFVLAHTVEEINLFNTQITVGKDGTIRVVESIAYDFGIGEKHGIYRDIPKTFTDVTGTGHPLSFTAISVTDEKGVAYQTRLSDQGSSYRIRVGDPDQTISGDHTYVISYTVNGAIFYTKDFDELYWNATGDEWPVPIAKSTATVIMPEEAAVAQYSCYEGIRGSTTPCGSKNYASPTEVQNSPVTFSSSGELTAGSGLTVAVGIAKGVITQSIPIPTEPSMEGVAEEFGGYALWELLLGFALPILTFIICFYVWFRIGRDPKEGTVIAEYDPPKDLSILEMSAIVHPYKKRSDTPPAIVGLAAAGACMIEQIDTKTLLVFHHKDYKLIETGGEKVLINDLDRELFHQLFTDAEVAEGESARSIVVSKINKRLMSLAIQSLNLKASKLLVSKGIYTRNPDTMKAIFITTAGVVGFGSLYFLGIVEIAPLVLGVIASAIILAIFGFIIPQKTQKGAEIHRSLMGLKLYLSVAEKDRINFHNAPEKTPQLFERLLPYAMLFGVVSIWVKEFEGIAQTPSYYHSNGAFVATAFASDMNSLSTSLAAVSATSSGSGGGGFSGGGGGGGGGGSW